MSQVCLIAVNSVIAGMIAGAGAIVAVAASDAKIDGTTFIIAGCSAIIAAGKDWLSYMQVPMERAGKIVGVALVALLLGGCFGNAAMVEAMRDNHATFCAKILTPWGSALYFQSNPDYGTATCEGMTITYGNPDRR